MAFQSLNKTSDYDIYTTQYLQNLALQIKLNQQNFDKNIAFFKTGVQETERPDSRSIEERAADVEKLKIQARVMLNKISDATNANEVLEYLTKNGELLFFFIQQFPYIEKQVKEQFSGGIRAPLLISLIYKRFVAQQEDSLLPQSPDFDIISKVMTTEDLITILNETNNDVLKTEIQNAMGQLPAQKEIKRLTDDPIRYKDELKFAAEMLKNSPNVDDYNNLIEEYNDASLKDDAYNYDLEKAENNMINKLSQFLVETANFRKNTANNEKIEKIIKETKSREELSRVIPKATDTRIKQKTEEERKLQGSRKKTLEKLQTGITLKPSKERVLKERKLTPQEELQSQLKTGIILKPSIVQQRVLTPQEQVQSEIRTIKRGRPKGSGDKNPRTRTSKAEMFAKKIPEAPTNPPIIIPQAPTNTPEIVPVPTGSGLLNQHEQMTHRFKVLKGEILAGNTASQVVKEMTSLVKKLVKSGELTLEQSNGIIKEIKRL